MNILQWIMILIIIVVIFIGILAKINAKKGKDIHPDYFILFIIGIIWIPVGLSMGSSIFWIVGLVFMAISIVNREKWKQRVNNWKNLQPGERTIHILVIAAIGLLLFFTTIVLMTQKGLI